MKMQKENVSIKRLVMIDRLGAAFLIFCLAFFVYHGQIGLKGKDLFYSEDPIKFSIVILILFFASIYAIWRSYKNK